MHEIGKTFAFAASHQLDHLPDSHKCARLHGHNYTVTLALAASYLDHNGFVIDYAMLDTFDQLLKAKYDHRHLNDVVGSSELTTAERLAEHFFNECQQFDWGRLLISVTVKETDKTFATYSLDP